MRVFVAKRKYKWTTVAVRSGCLFRKLSNQNIKTAGRALGQHLRVIFDRGGKALLGDVISETIVTGELAS